MQPRVSENQLKQWAVGDDPASLQFLKQIVLNFVEKIAPTLTEMEVFLASSDYSKIAKRAHQLKGTSGNLGLMVLHEYFLQLENEAKNSAKERVDHWIQISKEELPRTLEAFHQIRLG